MRFANTIRRLRHERDMTQAQLAEKLGVSMSYVCKVENGKLASGDFQPERFIKKLSKTLEADELEQMMNTST